MRSCPLAARRDHLTTAKPPGHKLPELDLAPLCALARVASSTSHAYLFGHAGHADRRLHVVVVVAPCLLSVVARIDRWVSAGLSHAQVDCQDWLFGV